MPPDNQAATQRLKRHRAKAERATVAVEMDEARLADAIHADEQTAQVLADLKASLKGAKQYVKRLSSELTLAQKLAKSARRDRQVAQRELTAHRLAAQKRAAKLASVESASGPAAAAEEIPDRATAPPPPTTSPKPATSPAAKRAPAKRSTRQAAGPRAGGRQAGATPVKGTPRRTPRSSTPDAGAT